MTAPKPLEEVLRKASPEPNTGCWLWTEGDNGRGYGRASRNNTNYQAHRLFYELLKGPIPEGHELDHLCRVTFCVNPDHLEPVPHRTNVRRGVTGAVCARRQRSKTHCPFGHPYEGDNLIVFGPRKLRRCRECSRERDRARSHLPHRKNPRLHCYPKKPTVAEYAYAHLVKTGNPGIMWGDDRLAGEILTRAGLGGHGPKTTHYVLNYLEKSPLFEKRLVEVGGRVVRCFYVRPR
jgi:hypothetical protein